VIGVVEAMKVFNEITADRSGIIARVLVRSGDVVTADQPLMLLDQRAQAAPAAGE
jgi:acetyl-CoA carboxylase biotin carboxyl carrier protein